MVDARFMQEELGRRFPPLSNRRKSGKNGDFSLWAYPYVMPENTVCSLDMVRLRLRFEGENQGVRLDEMAATFASDGYQSWKSRVKPGGWYFLHNWAFGDSSVTLGIGLMSANCSIDMAVGFLEFNPNKLAASTGFLLLLSHISEYVARAELVRYDLAVDVPVARGDVRLGKDGRKYECVISRTMTEYLGCRNAGGFVKVYDKTEEAKLSSAFTRVELTCDGRWSVEDVRGKWPLVFALREAPEVAGLPKNARAFLRALAELVSMGLSIEPYLLEFDRKTRKKYRDALVGCRIEFPELGAAAVLMQAVAWAELLSKD